MKKLTWKDFLLLASIIGHLLGARGIIPTFLAPKPEDLAKQVQEAIVEHAQDFSDAGP